MVNKNTRIIKNVPILYNVKIVDKRTERDCILKYKKEILNVHNKPSKFFKESTQAMKELFQLYRNFYYSKKNAFSCLC